MSKFLAPIHTWLFNKIKLHEELERDLVDSYINNFGEEINTIIQNIYNKYGEPIEDVPLESIIDTSNIHGWLQNKISLAETRQAAIITEITKNYGKKSLDLTIEIYTSQGHNCGNNAKTKYEISSAPKIFDALNNYILDGMPCDHANSVSVKEENLIEWTTSKCLHKGYWAAVSGDKNILYTLRYNWIKAFVEATNSQFTYLTTSIQDDVAEPFLNKIFVK